MATLPKVTLPKVTRDEYSAPFFDGAREGTLLVRRCENGHYMAPTQGYNGPAIRCYVCQSDAIDWAPVAGTGELVSWTVVHLRGDEPSTRIAGIVELDEGPWVKGLIDVPNDDELSAGTRVRVHFVDSADGAGEPIPAFRPLGA
jgi:uncharacterized protein